MWRSRLEALNFLLTNRIPRRWLTILIGWLSPIEQPLVRILTMAVWRAFCKVELDDARESTFRSMHACFVRELKPGARPIDARPGVLVSPCDAIIGACGRIEHTQLFQAKGMPYTLDELLGGPPPEEWRSGYFVTLRITAAMYHRFHAPYDCEVRRVTYISGDTWNVNPIALARIERLFCRNERAVIETHLAPQGHHKGQLIGLVAVAAVLVASIRLHFVDVLLHLRYRGANRIDCRAQLTRGAEMGWFQHGSTIIVLAPDGFALCPGLGSGTRIRVGEALLELPVQPVENGSPATAAAPHDDFGTAIPL